MRIQRAIDLAAVLLAAPFVLPVLGIACLAIALDDGRPFLFAQRRIGRFEKPFTIYKLRTMRKTDCEDQLKPRSGRDPRITRVGALLRKLSIDELPQLYNVFLGDMAIVGPRPEMKFIVDGYERWQNLRHLVKPGITGIWQTTVRSTVRLERPEATAIDLQYIRHQSMLSTFR